jgi:heptosyltransferase-2
MIRTLVVMPNWVGDTVMSLPVLEALAGAQREVVALAKPHLEPLLSLVPAVATVVPRAPDDGETATRIRAAACDESVSLPGSFRAAWLPFRGGVAHRWGYRRNLRSLLLSPAVPRPRRKRPQVEDYRELLEAMAVPLPASWTPSLTLDPAVRRRGAERLERARLDAAAPLVGLFPGAEFGPSKRWPWRRFAELATALRRARPELRQVILGGPREVWVGVRIHEESGKIHPLVGPDLDLGGLAAVLSHLDVLITNDSGPMHLAAALGVPCVALFGPTDPERTAPSGPGHRVLYTDRWCSPCFRRRCPLLHHKCLRDIGVETVAEATLGVLAAAG